MEKNFNSLFLVFFIPSIVAGCATTVTSAPLQIQKQQVPLVAPGAMASVPGVYHKVEKGQTLWRVSKIYGIDLDEIINSNRITDSAQILQGQTLFIPRGKKPEAVSYRATSTRDFIWPSKGKVISGFGDKTSNVVNKGVTIRAFSNAAVLAAHSGMVVFTTDKLKGYGKTVIISHDGGLMTVYSLLSHILVKPGERISQGSPIARSAGGLVHFEIRKGHLPQNPYFYLPR